MASVALGADHAGWELKEALKAWLIDQGHQILDFGTHSPDSVDYPDYAAQVAEAVAADKAEPACSSAAPASAWPSPPTRSPACAPPSAATSTRRG